LAPSSAVVSPAQANDEYSLRPTSTISNRECYYSPCDDATLRCDLIPIKTVADSAVLRESMDNVGLYSHVWCGSADSAGTIVMFVIPSTFTGS
jgi:hypothetical protein